MANTTESAERAAILMVDDEPDICEVVRLLLEKHGCTVYTAQSGAAALTQMQQHPDIDLIILDILMPELSGTDTCAALRQNSTAPVLFLSAKSQESDKQTAFAVGGDDYLTKPFSPAELVRRVESLLRRYRVYQGKNAAPAAPQGLTLCPEQKRVRRGGEEIALTDREYELLAFFAAHAGEVLDNRTLYENVWHYPYFPSSANTVMVHILKLRKKLEQDPAHPMLLRTVWGEGYRYEP